MSEYEVINQLPCQSPIEEPKVSNSIEFQEQKRTMTAATDIDNRKNYLTVEQLQNFLRQEQEMPELSIEDSAKLIARFEPSSEGQEFEELGVDGLRLLLLHDEFCIMNPNKSHRIYHDMTRPLTDYFIATSHNT